MKKATTTIPIVMASAQDPVGTGLVVSLARPGGNVTGNSSLGSELGTKRLEILNDAVPKLGRVGLLRPLGFTISQDMQLKALRLAAVPLKVKLEEIETERDPKSLDSAFQTAKQKQVKAIISLPANTGCRLFISRRNLSMKAVSCPTAWTLLTSTDGPLTT